MEERRVEPLVPRRPWQGRNVLLGVAGGIAAYKSVQVARDLAQLGANVDVVLTSSAREFVGAVTFEAVTGRPVHADLIAPGAALDHINLARKADVVCVAPATADLLARAAQGRSDDLLTAIMLATTAHVILCPAMNDAMWAHAQTRINARHVQDVLGYELVGPAHGALAAGEGIGPGRMEEPQVIVEYVGRALSDGSLAGKRLVVTAGPTREAVDPVRVISNRSSGKMGYAIASAAWRRGAEVVLISGPTALGAPVGPVTVKVDIAEEMVQRVRQAMTGADALIMAAAVADFRPSSPAASKIKKGQTIPAIQLEPAPDVLKSTLDARKPGMKVIGFALETDSHEANAVKKLAEKQLDMIVLNDATASGAGFEVSTNQVTIFWKEGEKEVLPLMSKDEVAEAILDRLVSIL